MLLCIVKNCEYPLGIKYNELYSVFYRMIFRIYILESDSYILELLNIRIWSVEGIIINAKTSYCARNNC